VQIPGLKYHEIRLTGRNFERFLISQLSWWSFLCVLYTRHPRPVVPADDSASKLIAFFIVGCRIKGIRILGVEVMRPRGLVGLGLDTLDHSQPEMAEALHAVIDRGALPLLVHCTQGKDRTGLVVAVVLMILSVPIEAVDHDYMLSGGELKGELEDRVKEIREIGLPDEWADTAPDMIWRIAEHIQSTYGGLDEYLDKIGFVESDRQRLRDILLY
jgi:protein-tyrosine phosphatase